MADLLLPGITAVRVPTARATQQVLHPDGVDRGPDSPAARWCCSCTAT